MIQIPDLVSQLEAMETESLNQAALIKEQYGVQLKVSPSGNLMSET